METLPATETKTNILVADDDESFRKWLTGYLSREGFNCTEVPDAHAAISALSNENKFDLLIADINMPGNNELELVRQIPKIREGLPVILVTGYPTVDSAVTSVNLPVIAYLVKPFEPSVLLGHIVNSLARSKIYASIERTKHRLETWQKDLSTIESLLRLKPDSYSTGVPVETFITLTVQNILEPLFDLKHLAETLNQQVDETPKSACALFECPRLESQVKLLDHTIQVLEHTKNSFKSKELGELRKKIEKFLTVLS